MRLDYHVLDVFTDTRFAGNPLAVVLGAGGLDAKAMQTIAREFNLPETVFVSEAENRAHTARMRIFTPGRELPFAGHPTVGTAVLLAELRTQLSNGEGDALVVLEQPIGIVRVGVRMRQGTASFAEFDSPKAPESVGAVPATDVLAAALGLIPSEIGFENHRPTRYSAGNPFIFVPVASLEAIAKARVSSAHWDAATQNNIGMFLYCRQTVRTSSAFHARMFAPHNGIAEDPATGSAAAAFAGVVHRFDDLPDGSHKRVIEQGFEMGRPSLMELAMDVEGGKLDTVRIGGPAVRVAEGKLEV
jgi:trans-2,3-dihydro-3-hydroxyanthranilate isomerase